MSQKNFNLLLKTEVITQIRKFPEKTENKKKRQLFSTNKKINDFFATSFPPPSLFLAYTYRQSLSFHRQTHKKQQADTP